MSTGTVAAPLVLIVSGPSGSGKSTLVQKILELPGTLPSISCTTRARRATEASGKCYDFVTEAEFDAMVETAPARFLQPLFRRAIRMFSEDARIFEEFAAGDHGVELRFGYKIIAFPAGFGRAARPCST